VVLTPEWAQLGGTTGMIMSAVGTSNIGIVDQRNSLYKAYAWNGSAYAQVGMGGFGITNIDAIPIGQGTPAAGSFTTLTTSAGGTLGGGFTASGPFTFTNTVTGSGNNLFNWAGPMTIGGAITSNLFNGKIIVDGTTYARTDIGIQAAITALGGNPGEVHLSTGSYTLANPVTITNPYQHLVGDGINSTVLNYTGGATQAIVDIGTSSTGTQWNNSVENLTVSGNANSANAIRLRGVHHALFSNLSLRNVTGAGIQTNFAVDNIYFNIHTTLNEGVFTTQPTNCFLLTGPSSANRSTDSTIMNTVCEGVSGSGIKLDQTNGITVLSGTSESNNRGLELTANSFKAKSIGADYESNTTEDILNNGGLSLYDNVCGSTAKTHAGSTSTATVLYGSPGGASTCTLTTIDSGAVLPVNASAQGISVPSPGQINWVWDISTQTLTNKTLTTPTITSPVVNGTPSGTGITTTVFRGGSGSANYTGTNTTYASVDTSNLCTTLTVPIGWKLSVVASGILESNTAATSQDVALADAGTTCSGGGTTPLGATERILTPPAAGTFDESFTTQYVLTGDGAAHSITLIAKTSNAADSWGIQNSSGTAEPSIIFTLMPSN